MKLTFLEVYRRRLGRKKNTSFFFLHSACTIFAQKNNTTLPQKRAYYI